MSFTISAELAGRYDSEDAATADLAHREIITQVEALAAQHGWAEAYHPEGWVIEAR